MTNGTEENGGQGSQQKVNLVDPPRINLRQITTLPDAVIAIGVLTDYQNTLYRALVLEGQFATTGSGSGSVIGPDDLIDPDNTTLAEVAEQANQALIRAAAAEARLDAIAAIVKLELTASPTYVQDELQSTADKVDQVIDASAPLVPPPEEGE